MKPLTTLDKLYGRKPYSHGSLDGIDLIMKSIMRDVPLGSYIDIGGNHPQLNNNTWLFYQLGWRGVVIDPQEQFKPLYARFRQEDIFISALISNDSSEREFHVFPDDTMSTSDMVTARRYAERFEPTDVTVLRLRGTPLSQIVADHLINEVHFCSIDVEGAELEVLQGMQLETFRPGAILIEWKNISVNSRDFLCSSVYEYLSDNRYKLVVKTHIDAIFIAPDKSYFEWIPRTLYL
jgi:FkbM family methyltransferase